MTELIHYLESLPSIQLSDHFNDLCQIVDREQKTKAIVFDEKEPIYILDAKGLISDLLRIEHPETLNKRVIASLISNQSTHKYFKRLVQTGEKGEFESKGELLKSKKFQRSYSISTSSMMELNTNPITYVCINPKPHINYKYGNGYCFTCPFRLKVNE